MGGSAEQIFFAEAGVEEKCMFIVHILSRVRSTAGTVVGLLHQKLQWCISLSLPLQYCWTGMNTSEGSHHRKEYDI